MWDSTLKIQAAVSSETCILSTKPNDVMSRLVRPYNYEYSFSQGLDTCCNIRITSNFKLPLIQDVGYPTFKRGFP